MLEKALRLYTPSLSERPMAEFLADKCDDLGFEDIKIDLKNNFKFLYCEEQNTLLNQN